jgi:predicted extracellular nuclease
MRRSLVLAVVLLVCGLVGPSVASAASTDLFFSEYVEGSGNSKALEIFNDTGSPVNLGTEAYNVQMFFNGSQTAGTTVDLTGTVADGDVFVLAQSMADPAILAVADQTSSASWFNGDDAVVLRKGTDVLDVIGQIGFDPGTEWGTGLTSTADNTLRRKPTIVAGDPNGSDAFDPATEWNGFANNTFDGLGAHTVTGGNAPVVVTCPPTLSIRQGVAGTAAVSATDADGTVTSLTLGSVTPAPATGSISLTGVTPASADGGTATATLSVDASVPAGSYAVELDAANDDATPQTATCTTTVNVQQILRVSDVQGSTTELESGPDDRSPLAPPTGNGSSTTTYLVQGVITQKTLARTSAGGSQNGFFLQDTLSRSDNDPNTSDGVFVFMGSFTSLIGGYVPRVGDEVIISARVSEFFNMTELSSASLVQVVNPMLDVDIVAPAFDASPPDDLTAAGRYWERREGMRGRVPAGAVVTGGRDVFASTADSEVWVIRGDSEVAQRSDPYARRAFRDAHPLDNKPGLVDDGNGYRILLGPLGVKATDGDNLALLPPARVFDSLDAAIVGGVDFSFDKNQINPAQQPDFTPGVDPSLNAPPPAFDRGGAYSIANFNVENLYDFRDDPFDGCDFLGNTGCPGVSPPFDYVPESLAAYDEHLGALASEVANDLHGPDILLVQEAEDQDICTVAAGALQCGTTDNADGKPDTLQELALRIADLGGPSYDAAFDRNGADDRGIVAAFLYRTDRVQLLPIAANDPVLGATPTVDYRGAPLAYNTDVSNPKALNAVLPADVDRSTGVDGSNVYTRAPQVGHFRVWRNGIGLGAWVELYAVSNHFSSGPDSRVGQRTEQAAYLAAIVEALQAADPQARVDAGGDLNVFPRPDDPLVPASDQLAPLYDLGLENLFDTLVAQVPASAYTYVFEGQAQTLDHQFVTPRLGDELELARVAHLNADWPADFAGDGPRGASDHDPLVARYDLPATLAQLQALLDYYEQQGLVDPKTAGQLRKHLDQAAAKLAQGNVSAYRSQIRAFADQTADKTPQSVDPVASEQLIAEAELILAG